MDDFIINPETGDLLIQNNDFVVGNANGQHEEDIIQTVPGEYKQYIFVGCDLYRYLKANATKDEIVAIVRKQLELDGFTVFTIGVDFLEDGTIAVDPKCDK